MSMNAYQAADRIMSSATTPRGYTHFKSDDTFDSIINILVRRGYVVRTEDVVIIEAHEFFGTMVAAHEDVRITLVATKEGLARFCAGNMRIW
jgi:hypothetical protein